MRFSSNSLGSFGLLASFTASNAVPAGTGYLGCYVDSNDRIMSVWANGYGNNDPSMTNDFCSYECRGYNYFGTEAGSYCFCSNQIAAGAALASDPTTCDMPCAGNTKDNCGGPWRLAVYTIFQTTSDVYSPTAVESTGSTSTSPSASTLTTNPPPTSSPSSKIAIGVGAGLGVPFGLGLLGALGYLLYRCGSKRQAVQMYGGYPQTQEISPHEVLGQMYGGYADGGKDQIQKISPHELPP